MKLRGLVPAFFTGSPLAFLLAGALALAGMAGAPALMLGAAVGTLAGRALLNAIKSPAPQRS